MWQPMLGQCIVKVTFPKGRKELAVSQLQVSGMTAMSHETLFPPDMSKRSPWRKIFPGVFRAPLLYLGQSVMCFAAIKSIMSILCSPWVRVFCRFRLRGSQVESSVMSPMTTNTTVLHGRRWFCGVSARLIWFPSKRSRPKLTSKTGSLGEHFSRSPAARSVHCF